MADPLRNFFKSQLIGEYSNTATSFTISTGDGALLPDPSVDGEYNLVIFEGTAGSSADEFEVVRVTAKSSDTLTVTRGQESTTPITVTSAFHSIIMAATKKTFDDINDAIDNVDLTSLTGVEELTFDSTGDEEFGLPAGTTAQRPASPSAGYMRWNSTDSRIEFYNGSRWTGLSEVGLEQVSLGIAQLSVTANDAVAEIPVEVEYLVIAGGGGGGLTYGAGGGAGGYRSSVSGESSGGGASAESTLSLTASTNYTVTVGAGGNGSISSSSKGSSGSNSVFSTITSTGGGGGGSEGNTTGASGGSGGGGGGQYTGASGGAGTTSQGYAGGNAAGVVTNGAAGGGGGAGQAGANGTDGVGGAGGNGIASSITGSSVTRAGGGGGNAAGVNASGGTGGGGDAGNPATSGNANTGGGGGGSGTTTGNGGSGVVILRYPSDYSITIGAGLTGSETTVGANKVATITAGTGNVSWSEA